MGLREEVSSAYEVKSSIKEEIKKEVKEIKDQDSIIYLVEHFKWSWKEALAIQAEINGRKVVAIVDTGYSGVVVLQGCYERLKLKEDDVVLFSITLAINTAKKPWKVFKVLKIKVGSSELSLLAMVLDGLYFNTFLGMSWLNKVKGKNDKVKNELNLKGEVFEMKTFVEPFVNLVLD